MTNGLANLESIGLQELKKNLWSIILKSGLLEVQQAQTDYFTSTDDFSFFIFNPQALDKYFDHCSMPKDWKYICIAVCL